jgi:hypothetical protein
MRVKAIVGATAALTVFALEYVPLMTAVTIYVALGVLLGLVSRRAGRWAKRGVWALVVGAAMGVALEWTLPYVIDTASSETGWSERVMWRVAPVGLKAGLVAAAVWGLVRELGRSRVFR